MLTLELTLDEVNLILQILCKLPYEQSSNLIHKIKGQGDQQVCSAQVQAESEAENQTTPQESVTE